MLRTALELSGPAVLRFPKTAARQVPPDQVGTGPVRPPGASPVTARSASSAVGKLLEAAEEAAALLADEGVEAALWDVRVVRPLDPVMVADAGSHALVVTVEDGIRNGGAGNFIADAIADLNAKRQSPPVLNLGRPHGLHPARQARAHLGPARPGRAGHRRLDLQGHRPRSRPASAGGHGRGGPRHSVVEADAASWS